MAMVGAHGHNGPILSPKTPYVAQAHAPSDACLEYILSIKSDVSHLRKISFERAANNGSGRALKRQTSSLCEHRDSVRKMCQAEIRTRGIGRVNAFPAKA